MAQVWLHDVSLSLGGPLLLDAATLQIEEGERIGLLGRNGAGKSTLLRLLMGDISPDSGQVGAGVGTRIALLPQDVPDALPGTVYDVVASGGQEHLDILRHYREVTLELARSGDSGLLRDLERIQHRLETSGAWHFHQRVETVLSWTELDAEAEFQSLSAGLKRRVFLARALASDPDVLLLDEPTNHLDLNAILWLEDFLVKFNKTLVFVTHDRAFLQRMANRIVEIDRGRLLSFDCDYETYLSRRQDLLDAEEKAWHEFDRKLAKEEAWIRQGIKARRTRNEGRVRALERLRAEREQRRERMKDVRMAIVEADRSGRLVVDAEKISFSFGSKKILQDFSTTIIRGDRVGIIGPNGSGKTTLLRLLLGEIEPQKGRIRLGAGLKIAYFDQLRTQLDETQTLRDTIADGGDIVSVGKATRHVMGYLQDFLFSPDQIIAPVRLLSGGERMRLLLAKLFSMPSNVLVLDEPTNDLDTETLALLEEKLLDYSGTILLVSHDRAFLNNVVTSTIVFESEGRLKEYVGGYDDWLRQRPELPAPVSPAPATVRPAKREERSAGEQPPRARRKPSFKEIRELEALPEKIEALEKEQHEIIAMLSSSSFYANNEPAQVTSAKTRLQELEEEIAQAYTRWEELEALGA
ncbi:MAG: ribosomal protection-like ABC-F family protein [Thermoleophilia bacterium]|jgi:ATP-binding cassette subfamily F protein uup